MNTSRQQGAGSSSSWWTPLTSPVFLISAVRSGSTLLRCILNAHKEIYAPHEFHLCYLEVSSKSEYLDLSLGVHGIKCQELRDLLWDRAYHALLARSGKRIIADKSPSNLWHWRDLIRVWPSSRFILLKRDPAAIVRSIVDMRDGMSTEEAVENVCRSVDEMEKVRECLDSYVILSYEDLLKSPEKEIRNVCGYLDVPFQRGMCEYGCEHHGPFSYGIGDWGPLIESGRIQDNNKGRISPSQWPELSRACRIWGYPNP